MLAWIAWATALAAPPLTIEVDGAATAVVVDCAGKRTTAPVTNGVASFDFAPKGDCTAEVVRPLGAIGAPGVYECGEATGCVLTDVAHRAVSDAAGRVNIILTSADSKWLELTCKDGFRARGDIRENVAVFDGVPRSECELHFKGGTPARFRPVEHGTYRCALTGVTAVCTRSAP